VSTPSTTSPSPPPAATESDDDRRRWGAGTALLALVATFGATIFTSIPALIIGEDTTTAKVVGTLVSSLLQNVAFVGVPILVVSAAAGRLRRRDLGWRMPARPGRAVGLIVLAFVLYIVLSGILGQILGADGEQDDLPAKLGAKDSVLSGIAIALAVTVLAPIGEETLLRGIIYPGLRNGFSRVVSAPAAIGLAGLVDGLIFGALHIGGSKAIFLPILALFGFVLCMLYQSTGSLYASILLHATNNTIAMKVALDWSVQGAVLLWVSAITILTLLALAARAAELRWPGGGGRQGSPAPVAGSGA
jgi:membrane protease YdiL (CAAX protease family)